jgi:hypothetical protein
MSEAEILGRLISWGSRENDVRPMIITSSRAEDEYRALIELNAVRRLFPAGNA